MARTLTVVMSAWTTLSLRGRIHRRQASTKAVTEDAQGPEAVIAADPVTVIAADPVTVIAEDHARETAIRLEGTIATGAEVETADAADRVATIAEDVKLTKGSFKFCPSETVPVYFVSQNMRLLNSRPTV